MDRTMGYRIAAGIFLWLVALYASQKRGESWPSSGMVNGGWSFVLSGFFLAFAWLSKHSLSKASFAEEREMFMAYAFATSGALLIAHSLASSMFRWFWQQKRS